MIPVTQYSRIEANWQETPPRKPKYRRKGNRAEKTRASSTQCRFKATAAEVQALMLRWGRA